VFSGSLFLYPEDGGNRFLWNVCAHLPNYMVPHPTRQYLCIHCCENSKSQNVNFGWNIHSIMICSNIFQNGQSCIFMGPQSIFNIIITTIMIIITNT
jgi:hypothetical protein